MEKRHSVEKIRFRDERLHLVVDGKRYEYPIEEISRPLAGANKTQRETFEVMPSGYGIHWSLIDEDLSIDGLLRVSTSKSGTQSAAG